MKLLKTIKHEYLQILPPPIFFLIALTFILGTKRLITSKFGLSRAEFGAVLFGDLRVGNVVPCGSM